MENGTSKPPVELYAEAVQVARVADPEYGAEITDADVAEMAQEPALRAMVDHVWEKATASVTVTQTIGTVPAGATVVGYRADRL